MKKLPPEKKAKAEKTKSETTLIGAAGEHYVMSELLRRNYISSLAPRGVPNTDIVVTNLEGTRLCSIQVKSRRAIGSDGGWHMKEKHEKLVGDRLFYCFVNFGPNFDSPPITYIIPANVVAEVLSRAHGQWLLNPGKKGRSHQDSNFRRLLPDYKKTFVSSPNPYPAGWLDKYLNAWDSLGLEPAG